MELYNGLSIKKEEHPEWPNRCVDPSQLEVGMKLRRFHCLQERESWNFFGFVPMMLPPSYMEYVITIDEFGSTGEGLFYIKDHATPYREYFLSDCGIVPYTTGDWNGSNFCVIELPENLGVS